MRLFSFLILINLAQFLDADQLSSNERGRAHRTASQFLSSIRRSLEKSPKSVLPIAGSEAEDSADDGKGSSKKLIKEAESASVDGGGKKTGKADQPAEPGISDPSVTGDVPSSSSPNISPSMSPVSKTPPKKIDKEGVLPGDTGVTVSDAPSTVPSDAPSFVPSQTPSGPPKETEKGGIDDPIISDIPSLAPSDAPSMLPTSLWLADSDPPSFVPSASNSAGKIIDRTVIPADSSGSVTSDAPSAVPTAADDPLEEHEAGHEVGPIGLPQPQDNQEVPPQPVSMAAIGFAAVAALIFGFVHRRTRTNRAENRDSSLNASPEYMLAPRNDDHSRPYSFA